MKKSGEKLTNLILALGMLLIAAGFFLILCCAGTNPGLSVSLIPGVLLLLGMINLFYYISGRNTPFRLFCGIDCCLSSVFSYILVFFSLPFGFSTVWPAYMIFTALSLFIAGRTKGKRFSMNYDFTCIVLLCFGIIFFLFSFQVIKLSFSQISMYALPVLLILAGIVLIVLFRRRKAILKMLPEDFSKELNSGINPDDNDDDSGVIL